jgi:hypothetical protein
LKKTNVILTAIAVEKLKTKYQGTPVQLPDKSEDLDWLMTHDTQEKREREKEGRACLPVDRETQRG